MTWTYAFWFRKWTNKATAVARRQKTTSICSRLDHSTGNQAHHYFWRTGRSRWPAQSSRRGERWPECNRRRGRVHIRPSWWTGQQCRFEGWRRASWSGWKWDRNKTHCDGLDHWNWGGLEYWKERVWQNDKVGGFFQFLLSNFFFLIVNQSLTSICHVSMRVGKFLPEQSGMSHDSQSMAEGGIKAVAI